VVTTVPNWGFLNVEGLPGFRTPFDLAFICDCSLDDLLAACFSFGSDFEPQFCEAVFFLEFFPTSFVLYPPLAIESLRPDSPFCMEDFLFSASVTPFLFFQEGDSFGPSRPGRRFSFLLPLFSGALSLLES